MKKFHKMIFMFLNSIILVGILVVSLTFTNEVSATPITIDMSSHGLGSFNQSYFMSDGVVFTEGNSVGFTQGDESLIFDFNGGVAGLFAPVPVTSVSVRIAPRLQGTWAYRLAATDVLSNIIDSKTILVTQDVGDPEHSGFGYFSIELSGLPGAVGFFAESTFIRSSSGSGNNNDAALSSMSFTPFPVPAAIPEPSTVALFIIGLAGLLAIRAGNRS